MANFFQSIGNFLSKPRTAANNPNPVFNKPPVPSLGYAPFGFNPTPAQQQAIRTNPSLSGTIGTKPTPVPTSQNYAKSGFTPSGQSLPQPGQPGFIGPTQSTGGGQPSNGGQPLVPGAGAQPDAAAQAQATMQKTGQQLMSDLANAYMSGQIDPSKPFALDEFLARNAATQAISPYYAQVNQRFQQGIRNLTQSGQQSTARGIQGIQQTGETEVQKQLRLLQSGQQSTGEQYSGQGLYDSGERARAQGLMGAQTSQGLSNYLGGQQRDIASTNQQQQDLLNKLYLQKQETENQLARNQGSDVEAAVQEAQRQAATQQGVSALEGQPLTASNMQDYFNTRAKALAQFLPSQ